MRSERRWNNADEYAVRSMAVTRATGKACRLSFSPIMALAGKATTPAEEMPEEPEKPKRGRKKKNPTGVADPKVTTKDQINPPASDERRAEIGIQARRLKLLRDELEKVSGEKLEELTEAGATKIEDYMGGVEPPW